MRLEVARGKGTLSESKGRKETGKKPWWVWWLRLLDGSDSPWLRAYWEHSKCRHILHCPLQTVGISKACFILKSIILANTTKQHHFFLDNAGITKRFWLNLTFDEVPAHCWFLQAWHWSSDTDWTAFVVRFWPRSLPEHTVWPCLEEYLQPAWLQLWQKIRQWFLLALILSNVTVIQILETSLAKVQFALW